MKKIISFILIFATIALATSGCNIFNSGKDNYKAQKESNTPYEIVKSENYNHYNEKGRNYYVYINGETTKREEIEKMYDEITSKDNCDIHTVWFYFDREDATKDADGQLAKVIMKQYSSGIDPAYMWRD